METLLHMFESKPLSVSDFLPKVSGTNSCELYLQVAKT